MIMAKKTKPTGDMTVDGPSAVMRAIAALEAAGFASAADQEKALGADPAKLWRWMNGGRRAPGFSAIDTLAALSDATGVTLDWIIFGQLPAPDQLAPLCARAKVIGSICSSPLVALAKARAVMR
jgi:hypothetical protein